MKKAILKFGVVVAIAAMLPGCSVMRTLGLYHPKQADKDKVQTAESSAPTRTDARTDSGRHQLDQGNFGLAIQSFRSALEYGETRAPALNGLGVAYAKLGRPDLAASYFRSAMDAAPGEERYAANLSQLLNTSGMERRMAASFPAAASSPDLAADAPVAVAAATAPAPQSNQGRLVRTSTREYILQTASPAARPVRTAQATTKAGNAETRFQPLIRIELGKTKSQPADAPGKP